MKFMLFDYSIYKIKSEDIINFTKFFYLTFKTSKKYFCKLNDNINEDSQKNNYQFVFFCLVHSNILTLYLVIYIFHNNIIMDENKY